MRKVATLIMRFLIFLIVFVLINTVQLEESTKHPFEQFGRYEQSEDISKEYFYSTTIHATWSKAIELCELFGMNLLTFNDTKEEENFREKFASFFEGRDSYIFIGANTTEARSKTNWNWINGEKLNFDIKWASNQPHPTADNELCLSLDEANPLLYHDIACDEKCPFVCQEEWHYKKIKVKVSGSEL